jgi:flagellar hook-basal body complex protein FliE
MKVNEFVQNTSRFERLNNVQKQDEKNNGFLSIFKDKLDEVNEKQITAEKTTESFIKGDGAEVHEVLLSTQEAKMSLELAVQVRNKLVEAYQEINRMQI